MKCIVEDVLNKKPLVIETNNGLSLGILFEILSADMNSYTIFKNIASHFLDKILSS